MRVCVFGPLRIEGPDGPVPVRGAHARAAMSWLAANANERVGFDALAQAVWPRPPMDADHRLRIVLRSVAIQLPAGMLTVGATARLVLPDGALDADQFERLVDDAYAHWHEGSRERARANVDEALRLWRGAPYPHIAHTTSGTTEIGRLSRLHGDALELLQECVLADHVDFAAVADLRYLVGTFPNRVGLRRQLARALYRTGRQAEALQTLREATAECGDDPSTRSLVAAILRHDDLRDLPHTFTHDHRR